MQHEIYKYSTGDLPCEGFVVRKADLDLPAPVVVICHHWNGRDELMDQRAKEIAAMGYIAFAVDLYGNHATATEPDTCASFMNPMMADRAMLRERLQATIAAAKRIPGADGKRIVVMGFCFGGLCALDVARAGIPGVVGVASFHGLFTPPGVGPQSNITAKVLVMHGFDDPLAPQDSMLALTKELTSARANWEIVLFGNTGHAFTNPRAQDKANGMAFCATMSQRAFARLETFLRECFHMSNRVSDAPVLAGNQAHHQSIDP